MKAIRRRFMAPAFLAACASVLLCAPSMAGEAPKEGAAGKPTIKLLEVPNIPPGPDGTAEITGKVTGLPSFKAYRVAIYSKGGDTWWAQPTAANPLTEIGEDGEFSADIRGGTEYAALLVKETYKPKAQLERLPVTGGEVLAITRKKPESPAK